ncbi:hypothetical protein DPMN_096550 [Dreissena polymorpha]|uniref:Uncharacterized protein n=1 Tax=Dreissena polymorpha TaxID=45954 RepID=A0A9D4R3R8_DREPO|nr:hypothetical protein DPMN_096550 [Dreissena polymorpha]
MSKYFLYGNKTKINCTYLQYKIIRGEDVRPEFRQIGELRGLTDEPLLAVTATATEKVQQDILQGLLLSDDALSVGVLPDR